MTREEIQALIKSITGLETTASKQRGSMRNYTRFKVQKGENIFKPEQLKLRAHFPAVNKVSGCFVDDFAIYVFNHYITSRQSL